LLNKERNKKMSGKKEENTVRKQEVKAPRKVEVKVALPWVIILVLATLAAGFVSGWHTKSNLDQDVHAEAESLAEA
jgi:hypothetical protein